jgi:hypothetical protein
MRKLKGRKVPKKKKKLARDTKRKSGSLSGTMNSITVNGFTVWLSLDLTVMFVMTSRPSIMNATVRIVYPNPIFGISLLTIMGRITPPSEEPDAMIPKAVARL